MKSSSAGMAGIAISVAMCCSGPVQAHHSTAAEFDQSKPLKFTGTVQKIAWTNPHVYTYVEVKQAGAAPVVYHIEGGSPNTLFRQGWRKDSLKVGDVVTVTGQGAKNPESTNVGAATILTADGKKVFTGDGPAKLAE